MSSTSPTVLQADSARCAVLMYHRVGPVSCADDAKYTVAPERFAAQMRLLADAGLRAVSLERFVDWLEGGPAPEPGSFVITFDDGYLDVRRHALPVLKALGWPFSVFLVTDRLGGQDDWGRYDALASGQHPLLSADDVLAMRTDGASFHSHSRSHASLPRLDDAELASQLHGSRTALAGLLGDAQAFYLAYPYGHVDDRVESAARAAGYRAGFSVQPGFNRCDTPAFRLRRLDVFGTDTPRQLLRKLRIGGNDGSWRTMLGYYGRRVFGASAQGAA